MKKNMGIVDQIIRIALAAIVGVLYWQGVIGGALTIVLGIAALILLVTGFVSFCPLYAVLGLKTVKAKLTGKE